MKIELDKTNAMALLGAMILEYIPSTCTSASKKETEKCLRCRALGALEKMTEPSKEMLLALKNVTDDLRLRKKLSASELASIREADVFIKQEAIQ